MGIVTQGEVRVSLGLTGSLSDADRAVLQLAMDKADAKVRNVLRYDPERKVHTNRLYPVMDSRARGSSGSWDVVGNRAVLQRSGGGDELQLTHLPVRQIGTLSEDPSANAGKASGSFATALTEGTDYYTDWDVASLGSDGAVANDGISYTGIVYRTGSSWPSRARSVQVTYYAGYTADEFRALSGELDGTNIHEAALMIAAATYKRWKALGLTGTSGTLVAGIIQEETMGEYSYKLKDSDEGVIGGISDVSAMKVEVPTAAAIALSSHINIGVLFA